MVIILLELQTRVNPDRNIFLINVELTSTFFLYKGLVHHKSPNLKFTVSFFVGYHVLDNLQGYSQRMTLQRLLYEMYTVCFIIFRIPCNCKAMPNY